MSNEIFKICKIKNHYRGTVNGTYGDGFTQSSTNSNGLQASLKFKDSTGQDNKKSQKCNILRIWQQARGTAIAMKFVGTWKMFTR